MELDAFFKQAMSSRAPCRCCRVKTKTPKQTTFTKYKHVCSVCNPLLWLYTRCVAVPRQNTKKGLCSPVMWLERVLFSILIAYWYADCVHCASVLLVLYGIAKSHTQGLRGWAYCDAQTPTSTATTHNITSAATTLASREFEMCFCYQIPASCAPGGSHVKRHVLNRAYR